MADDTTKDDVQEGASEETAPKAPVPADEASAEEKAEAPVKEPKKEKPQALAKADVKLTKDAEKILDLVEKLSVLDLANLVKAMEEKFGISSAAPVAIAATAPSGGGDAGGGAEEPSEVNVELTSAGGQKIPVIKAVREITGLGLKEAKDIVDGAPKVVKENVPKKEADELKAKLEATGATVTFK